MITAFSPLRPYAGIPLAHLDAIERNLERSQALCAKAVLLALCRVANHEGKATFSRPIAYIATLASLGRRTVEARLLDLERLKLVKIRRGALRCPHTYTLPEQKDDAQQVRNDTQQVRSVAHGTNAVPCAPTIHRYKGTLSTPEPNARPPRIREGYQQELRKGEDGQ